MIRGIRSAILVAVVVCSGGSAAAQDAPMAQMPAKMTFTIPEAIELARRNNIGSITQQEAFRLAQAEKMATRATYLPSLGFSGGWTRNSPVDLLRLTVPDTVVVDTGAGPDTTVTENTVFSPVKDAYSFRFSLSQPLFNSARGSYLHTPRAAAAAVRQREQDLRSTLQGLALETKRLCYNLVKTQMLVDVRTQATRRSEEQLETSKARFDLGSASMSDYLKAKVSLGSDSLQLIQAENEVAISRATLNDFLGLPVDRATEIDATLEFEPFPLPSPAAREQAVATHPDVMSQTHAYEGWSYALGGRQWTRLPSVNAVANYSWDGISFPDDLDQIKAADRASIGIQFNYTIFSGFSTTSSIKQAKIQKHLAQAELVQARRTVSLAIKTATLRLDEARKRYHVSEEQVRSAQEDFNIAQEKYNLGAATILDVLDAQFSISEAETGKIEAVFDYNLAVAELEKAMGGGD